MKKSNDYVVALELYATRGKWDMYVSHNSLGNLDNSTDILHRARCAQIYEIKQRLLQLSQVFYL